MSGPWRSRRGVDRYAARDKDHVADTGSVDLHVQIHQPGHRVTRGG